jgi:hypothetical protein
MNRRKYLAEWLLLLLVFLTLATVYCTWSATPALNDLGGDSAVYLLSAQYYAAAMPGQVVKHFALSSVYPPLYPLTLAILGASDNLYIAHALSGLWGAMALVFFYWWMRTSGLPLLFSVVALVIIAAAPGIYFELLFLHSEPLFLFCIGLFFFLMANWEKSGSARIFFAASGAASAAALTRSIGLAAVVTCVFLLLIRRPAKWKWLIIWCLTPMALWQIFGPASRTSYVDVLLAKPDLSDSLAALISQCLQQFFALWDGWKVNISWESVNPVPAIVLAVLCTLGFAFRLRYLRADAIFVLVYFIVLLAWPFPAERVRFMMPLVPIVLVQMFLGARWLRTLFPGRLNSAIMTVALLIPAIAFASTLFHVVARYQDPTPAGKEFYRHTAMWYAPTSKSKILEALDYEHAVVAAVISSREWLVDGACVYSIKPSVVAFFTKHISILTPKSVNVNDSRAPALGCKYVYMFPFASPTYSQPFFPMGSWPDVLRVVRQFDDSTGGNETATVGVLAEVVGR